MYTYFICLISVSNKNFKGSLRWWLALFNETFETFNTNVHILQYERLKTDMKPELRKLADFLGATVTDEDIECTQALQEGQHHRKTSADDRVRKLRLVYDDDKMAQLREGTLKAEEILQKHTGTSWNISWNIEDRIKKNDTKT